ncbi:putative disease resistance protein At5g47280 isoform X3 [Prosopis cineraria]|uniref:putative disease resistance protein At5g47280 isoform X3 n=1 Tax=Prosopis cineraria TaxID=364024 RepID=UPI00240F9E1B|nr:putative disease resistance protein At5g47280 isoform X3 [Prosopis cineraria]
MSAMIAIHKLMDLSFAARINLRRTGGSDLDNYYNNHLLMQHGLLRELAIRTSNREPAESKRRLILDMFGNHQHPEWWPKHRVDAPILSMSTGKLRRIKLQQVSLSYPCKLKNVHKLCLYMCKVREAFENNSMEFSKAMPTLVELNIDYCKDLVGLPVGFCNIATLKKLSICSCPKFFELPQEIGKLEKLELLRISHFAEFKEMPE